MTEPRRIFPIAAVPQDARARLAMAWQMRALLLLEQAEKRTNGGDRMFRILLAALAKEPPNLPIYSAAARIDKLGTLWCEICDTRDAQGRPVAAWSPIMPKRELIARTQELIDALDLSYAEAVELCTALERWIYEDLSPGQMTVEDRVPGVDKPS